MKLLPDIIAQSFEIYNEIPFEIIQRKLSSVQRDINTNDLLLLIEEVLQEGAVSAMISKDIVIKK